MTRALILDGKERHALAAVRSLGRKGIHVVVGGEEGQTLAGASRFCSETLTYPPPDTEPDRFISELSEECRRRNIDVLYPMSDRTWYHVLQCAEMFDPVSVPGVNFETYEQVTNKWKLVELAQKLGLPVPRTHFLNDRAGLRAIRSELEFPIVVKPYRSRMWVNGRWISGKVRYASDFADLERIIEQHEFFKDQPVLLQEYIQGEGRGLFVLYDHGNLFTSFAHRRLRQLPPSGGVAVLSEGVQIDPAAYQMARRLFDHLRWHGVAMLEYIRRPDGSPCLMEVNARFWGSLQLAIDAGVDFPWLLHQLTSGERVSPPDSYNVNVKSRWLLGDVYRSLNIVFGGGHRGLAASRWRTLLDFFQLFNAGTKYDVNRWGDLQPFIHEVRRSLCISKFSNLLLSKR